MYVCSKQSAMSWCLLRSPGLSLLTAKPIPVVRRCPSLSVFVSLAVWAPGHLGNTRGQAVHRVMCSSVRRRESPWPIESAVAWQCKPRIANRNDGRAKSLLICLPRLLGQIPGPCHRLIMYYCCWQALHPGATDDKLLQITMPWLIAFFKRDCFSTARNRSWLTLFGRVCVASPSAIQSQFDQRQTSVAYHDCNERMLQYKIASEAAVSGL